MLKEGSKEYERMANALSRSCVRIKQCKKCGGPTVDGYVCQSCGDPNPDWTHAQQAAWDRKHANGGRK